MPGCNLCNKINKKFDKIKDFVPNGCHLVTTKKKIVMNVKTFLMCIQKTAERSRSPCIYIFL